MLKDIQSEFVGSTGKWIGLSIGCFFLSLIPFIGLPYAICIKQKWIMQHTKFVGMNMEFIGKTGDLFLNMFKWGFFFIITFTLYGLVVPMKFLQWKTKNTIFSLI